MICANPLDYWRGKQSEREDRFQEEDRRARNENLVAQKEYYEALTQKIVEDIRNRTKKLEQFKIDFPEEVSNTTNIENVSSENQKNVSINININIDNNTDISKIQSLIKSLQL